MKFSVFADLHHYPGVFMGGTVEDAVLNIINVTAK